MQSKKPYFLPTIALIAIVVAGFLPTRLNAQQALDALRGKVAAVLKKESTAVVRPAPTPSPVSYKDKFEEARRSFSAKVSSTFLDQMREQDPFGTHLRQSLKDNAPVPAQLQPSSSEAQQVASQQSGFENVINALKVGAVSSANHEFLIGSDNFIEGDAFDVELSGQSYRIWIKEVTDEFIVFLDQQTGVVNELHLNFQRPFPQKSPWGDSGSISTMPPKQ